MKNPILTICLLISLFLSFSLTGQGWEKTYDGGANEIIHAATRTLDGGLVMVGEQYGNASGGDYALLYKTDASGNLEWSFYDSLHVGIFGSKILEVYATSDSNYLLYTGYSNTDTINTKIVQKLSSTGVLLWEIDTEDMNYTHFFSKLAESADGNYIFLGFQWTSDSTSVAPTVLKVDVNGNVLWEKIYDQANTSLLAYDLLITANGDIALTGVSSGPITSSNAEDAFVMRLDNDGNILWENTYNDTYSDVAYEILELPDGTFVIGGVDGNSSVSFYYTTLRKISATGDPIWYKDYINLGELGLNDLVQTSDGGFAIVGYYNEDPTNYDIRLVKVDENGDELWTQTYGRSKQDFGASLMLADDLGFYITGYTQKLDDNWNAYLIKTDSLGNSITNELNGNVYLDENFDCLFDSNEIGQYQWLITAQKGNEQYAALTDSLGDYDMKIDTGTYQVTAYPISSYLDLCENDFTINFTNTNQTITQDFSAQIVIYCPLLEISIGTPLLRRCFENDYFVNYCNIGTDVAEEAYIEIELDPDMIYQGASIPLDSQVGNTLFFDLGDVPMGVCGNFSVNILLGDSTTCDSIDLGATHCVTAHIYPDSICFPSNNWTGASIEVDAACEGDSIFFFIQNVGTNNMESALQYLVIEDDVVLIQGDFDLGTGESLVIAIAANGSTYRLEAEQEPNHPGMSMPSVTVEGCGDENFLFSFNFLNVFAQDDGDPFIDIDCMQNSGSFDPNDKQGFPLGYGTENSIYKGQDIEYLIRFQNTGTDTAFTVVVRDTLSSNLDLTTVRPGVSSHDYDFDISGNGALSFTFNNIMLPDSNVNLAGSNGFVKFKVDQKANLDLGTQIYNSASIYFDFNAPVQTNQTLHTIGAPLLSVIIDSKVAAQVSVEVFPNPFSTYANFEIKGTSVAQGTFRMYDVAGRLLFRQLFEGNIFAFEKEDINNGMYFFTIESEGELVGSGKLIAQ